MDKTIRIEGIGKVSAKPDLIRVTLGLSALDPDYGAAMDKADENLAELRGLATAAGLAKDALKTCDFSVTSEYNSVKGDNGEYRREFVGYRCRHGLKAEFGFDTALLGKVLSEFAKSKAAPQLGVEFALRDERAFAGEALASAVADARFRANAIATAAGLTLGDVLSIENRGNNGGFRSNTNVNFETRAVALSAKCASFEPENIDATDTVEVTFLVK